MPAAFGSFVRLPEGEPRHFEDCNWQCLGSTSNDDSRNIDYDNFSSTDEEEKGEFCGKPSRKLLADPRPGIVMGHNATQGPPPLAKQRPHTSVAVEGASAACADEPIARFDFFTSDDDSPHKGVGAGGFPGTVKGSSVPRRDPTPDPQSKVYAKVPAEKLFKTFVWRFTHSAVKAFCRRSGESSKGAFLLFAFARWRVIALVAKSLEHESQPPAKSKARKRKERKKRLPAGTDF